MRSRRIILALVALLASGASAGAQVSRSKSALLVVQAAPAGGGSVSITFVQIGAPLTQGAANQATLDFGPVSYTGGASRPGVRSQQLPGLLEISTDFGIRVDRKGAATKTATVSGFVLSGATGLQVSIDGIRLSSSAQVISANANFAVVVPHTLTVGVPATAPSGPLTITVGVLAVTN